MDDINCKPNYLSVMSYSLSFKFADKSRPLDYSRQALPGLDEANLNESLGIQGPTDRLTVYRDLRVNTIRPPDWRVVSAATDIDWNSNGIPNETGVSADINFIRSIVNGCDRVGKEQGLTVLTGHNDSAKAALRNNGTIL